MYSHKTSVWAVLLLAANKTKRASVQHIMERILHFFLLLQKHIFGTDD